MRPVAKLFLLILLVGGIFYAIDYFDIHIQEYDPKLVERVEERKEKAGTIQNEEPSSEEPGAFEGTADDVVDLVNSARKEAGLPDLSINGKLMESAMLKAQDMKKKDYFEHETPEGLDVSYFVNAAGYKFSAIGENLAEGYFSAQSLHEAWMNSEGHRKNVLSDKYEQIGVAILQAQRNGMQSFLAVQHFGTQLKEIERKPPRAKIVCDKKVKESCEDAEENREEVKDTIDKQEEIIDDAKDEGHSKKDLQDLYENLERLEDIKDDLKDYLEQCEEYFEKCDKWE